MGVSRTAGWVLGSALALFASDGQADTAGRAAAQVLFDEARQQMASGNFVDACPKLQESQRIDPGGGTILLLARCHAKEGKTASAWTEYQEALRRALTDKRKERERLARDEGAALEPRLSRLAIVVPISTTAAGLTVMRDGQEVGPEQWKIAVPVDPGPHEVTASAPGRSSWTTAVEVRGEGVTTTVTVPSLAVVEKPSAPGPLPVERPAAAGVVVSEPAEEARSTGTPQRVTGAVVVALGLGAAGVGSAYAWKAKSTYASSRGEGACDAENRCTPGAAETRQHAFAQAKIATLLVGVGAAVIVGGVTLWLTAPRPSAASVALGYDGGQFILQGAW